VVSKVTLKSKHAKQLPEFAVEAATTTLQELVAMEKSCRKVIGGSQKTFEYSLADANDLAIRRGLCDGHSFGARYSDQSDRFASSDFCRFPEQRPMSLSLRASHSLYGPQWYQKTGWSGAITLPQQTLLSKVKRASSHKELLQTMVNAVSRMPASK